MKEFKIYELYNQLGNIVHIGCTSRTLNRRLYEHTKLNPKTTKHGKFYGHDLTINLIRTFAEDKADVAYYYEAYLKYMWGFNDEIKPERTTHSVRLKGGKTRGKTALESGQLYKAAKKATDAKKQSVLAYDINTNKFVGEYESQNEAARQLDCNVGNINKCIKGVIYQTKGYTFKRAS